MYGFSRRLLVFQRGLQTLSENKNGPSESLRRKVAELEKLKKKRNARKDQLFVQVPESLSFLDTATTPMILTTVAIALFAKILMMVAILMIVLGFNCSSKLRCIIYGHSFDYDDSKSQEMIERKIKNAPAGQGTVRMLTREEWERIREERPRTPFESKLARPNARVRTGEPLRTEDLKDWTIDVFTDALARAEESVRTPR